MNRRFTKFTSVLLSFCFLLSICFSSFAKESDNDIVFYEDEIFYEGVKYDIKVDDRATTITCDGLDVDFELKHDAGVATLTGRNVSGLESGGEILIEFDELSSEKVEASIYNVSYGRTNLVEEINTTDISSIDSTHSFDYEGQAAVAVGVTISAGTIITLLVAATAIVLIAGVTYCLVSVAVETFKKRAPNDYFPAAIVGGKVYFMPMFITKAVAAGMLAAGSNTYSFSGSSAQSACLLAGGSIGPEIDQVQPGSNHYYWHYHVSRSINSHAFFGYTFINNVQQQS